MRRAATTRWVEFADRQAVVLEQQADVAVVQPLVAGDLAIAPHGATPENPPAWAAPSPPGRRRQARSAPEQSTPLPGPSLTGPPTGVDGPVSGCPTAVLGF